MKFTLRRSSWMAVAASLAVLAGWNSGARAQRAGDLWSYGFALQAIDSLRITPHAGVTISDGAVSTHTYDFVSLAGHRRGHSRPKDAPQVYEGTAPAPGENFFGVEDIPAGGDVPSPGVSVTAPYHWLTAGGTTGSNGSAFANFPTGSFPLGGPLGDQSQLDHVQPSSVKTGPAGNFSRADVVMSPPPGGTLADFFTTGISIVAVQESYLSSTETYSQGHTWWYLTATFHVEGTGSIEIGGNFNDTNYFATGGSSPYTIRAEAYGNGFSGTSLTDLTTGHRQSGGRFNVPGSYIDGREQVESFSGSVYDFNVASGHDYQLSMAFSRGVVTSVPEPSSMALLTLGGTLGLLGHGLRRRRSKAHPPAVQEM